MTDSPARLDSWKDIARYLGRDIRTVMRWEHERGLPVHRLPGVKRSVVFAYPQELETWRATRGNGGDAATATEPAPPEVADAEAASRTPDSAEAFPTKTDIPARLRARWIAIAALAIVVLALVFVATFASRTEANPVRHVTIEGTALHALDADGRTRWIHRFDAHRVERSSQVGRWVAVDDLHGNGTKEIVVVVRISATPSSESVDRMFCFSQDGRVLWTRTLDARLQFAEGTYGPTWASEDLLAFEVGGRRRLAWAVRHYTWWPSMLVVLDQHGVERDRFVHAGWITTISVSEDGRRLLLSGVTNAHRSVFFAVLDVQQATGSAPAPAGTGYTCMDCPPGAPLQYFVFPRTDVAEQGVFPPAFPDIQRFPDGAIQVRVWDNNQPHPPGLIYEFSPIDALSSAFALQRWRPSDSFWEWHRRLRADGRLDHDEPACPYRGAIEVRHWTPSEGWQTIRVASN